MSEEFVICNKALDRCYKKDSFRRDYEKCLEYLVCPKCGDDLLAERNPMQQIKFMKCLNPECNFSIGLLDDF